MDPDLPRRVSGIVVRGDRRGRRLGFPTANLDLSAKTLGLRTGVYAGRALGHAAAISIGRRPTFGDGLPERIEVHILDFEGDLYGKLLDVEILDRLRDELRFDSTDELVAQMRVDLAAVRERAGSMDESAAPLLDP